MSITSPPSTQDAVLRLDARARSLVRSWRLTLFATACFVAMWVLLAALAIFIDRLLYVPLMVAGVVASAYNVRRFLPRLPEAETASVPLSPREMTEVRTQVRAHTDVDVPEQIHLTADPFVRIDDDGVLRLGMPAAICLDASDISVLVEDAALVRHLLDRPVVARARRIADGRLGRGLRDGPQRFSRRLLAALDARAVDLYEALDDCVSAERDRRAAAWGPTLGRHGSVVEAWSLVLQQWVVPALYQRYLPVETASGTRDLLVAATGLGLTDGPVVAPAPLLAASQAVAHEEAVTRTLSVRPDELQVVTWGDHAPTVLVPMWRRTVARGLVAAARAVGDPRPATLRTFIEILEQGWDDTLAAGLADRRDGPEGTAHVLPDLLAAATWLTALERPGARLSWTWPFGPEVELPDGAVLDAGPAAAAALEELAGTGAMAGFRQALLDHEVDIDTPIWLDEGAGPEPDRVLASIVVSAGWRKSAVLVLSQQFVRVLEDSYLDSARRDLRLKMVGPDETLQPIMRAVEDGEAGDPAVQVQLQDVVHAELASILGGMYWRLRLWTVEGMTRIYGVAAPDLVEQELEGILQDRLRTRWTHLPKHLQAARFWGTCLILGLGILMIPSGPIALVTGDMSALDAGVTSGLGIGVVLLVLLPGMVLSGIDSRRAARATGHRRPAPRHAGGRRTTSAG